MDQMEKSCPTACSESSAFDSDSFEKDLIASSDVINGRLKAMFEEYIRKFNELKSRQQKLQDYASSITEKCRNGNEHRNLSCDKEDQILLLNVGGEDINIRRTAVHHDGSDDSVLSILLSSHWAYRFVRNRNGRIFLNLNPAWIAPAINVMRDPSMKNSRLQLNAIMSVEQKIGFDAVRSYYNLGYLFPRPSVVLSTPSTIPSMHNKEYLEALYSFLQPEPSAEEEVLDVRLDLIHRGSRDGYDPSVLHLNCTGNYRTVIVIEDDKKNVFGGYFNNDEKAKSCFLFSLTSHETPEKYTSKTGGDLQRPFEGSLLINFGVDLNVHGPPHHFGYSTLGNNFDPKTRTTLNGAPNSADNHFLCHELEVYRILSSPSNAPRAFNETHQKMMSDSTILSRTELTCPLRSWILAAVNRCGYQCSDFDAKLIYTGVRDDKMADANRADLVASCNGKAMTVCIIKDNRGHTLGCFSDTEWSRALTSVPTANSFTFSLGGAVACHSMQSRSVVDTGPQHLISFGPEFNVKPNYSMDLIVDGCKVTASGGTQLMVHQIAVYEVVPRAAASDETTNIKALSEKMSTDTRDIVENIRKMDEQVRQAELKLLVELLQIEHLSSSRKDWDTKIGLKAEWRKILDTTADCRLDASGKTTWHMLGEVMARLNIADSNGETKGEAVDDEVVSYNVGGTIIAVLRSTLVRQAPNSAFASRFSGRWSEQTNEDKKDGHICLVRYL
jgi:TLD